MPRKPDIDPAEFFERIEIRAGEIVNVEDHPKARRPSYIVTVDFGEEVGTRVSVVGAKNEYTPDELLGRQVVGVVNFPALRVGGVKSECLLLGVPTDAGELSLLMPSRPAKRGGEVY